MNEWVCSIGGMMLTGGTLKHLDKRYVEATLSTTNSTQTSLRLKPSLYSEAVPAWAMVLPHNIQWKWKRKITAFSLYIWPPYIDTLQHTELHILNFIALPRLNPYLFLDKWGGGKHWYASLSYGVSISSSNMWHSHKFQLRSYIPHLVLQPLSVLYWQGYKCQGNKFFWHFSLTALYRYSD